MANNLIIIKIEVNGSETESGKEKKNFFEENFQFSGI